MGSTRRLSLPVGAQGLPTSLLLIALTVVICSCTWGSKRQPHATPQPPSTTASDTSAPLTSPSAGYTSAPGAYPVAGFQPVFLPPPAIPLPQFALGVQRPVNVGAVFGLASTPAPGSCPPFEAAPGVWVSLDCDPQPPVRNARRFVAPRGLREGVLPLSVDHRANRMVGPIKDQGLAGTCTAFSLSSTMDAALRRLGKQDVISPLHVWSRYRVPRMGEAGDANINRGVTVEESWPYDPAKACRLTQRRDRSCEEGYGVRSNSADATLEAEVTAADNRGRYVLATVEELQSKPGNPEEVAAVIAGGDSLWVAFEIDARAWQLRDGDNVVDDYTAVEASGHAVALSGYRTVNGVRYFLIHNSWGPRWGENGYAWISENMVRRHMIYAYRIEVRDASVAPVPPPTPEPTGCPTGQVRDRVSGNCSPACPSGSAPAAGFCLPTVPGFGPPPTPGNQPAPPPPSNARCPSGQGPDIFTGRCVPYCPNGLPAIGGLCLSTAR